MAYPSFDALDQELAHCAAGYRGGAGIAPLEHGRRVIAALLRHPKWDDQHVDFQVQVLQQGGGILLNLYKARGDRTVLDEALTILTLGTNLLEEGHGSRPALLANLGLALRIAGEDDSSPETVLKAIACLETSIAGTAYSDPDRPNRLSNLGNAWRAHYDQTTDSVSLDKAIDCLDKAFALRPSADLASNLSVGLRDRFAASGSRADLEHALHLASGAVEATPPDVPGFAIRLNNLSILHAHRFELDRHEDDGRAALDLLVRIVEMTPEGSPDLGYRLLNLGNMYRRMFTVTAKAYAEALAVARYGPDGMAMIRSAYADALSVLGALEQDVQQTELAVNLAREALAAISPAHAERHSYLSSLAQTLQRHGTLLRDATWLREAEALLSGGLDTGPHARPTAILLALNRARIAAELFVLTGDRCTSLRVPCAPCRPARSRAASSAPMSRSPPMSRPTSPCLWPPSPTARQPPSVLRARERSGSTPK
jgi:tetratricopeptide (TPR) repeat protein